ncbi:hypothetical protein HWI79_145 [Cryptosporidium felis]|nr:hypothetical protein HWI79_145 [Cryptosporidium felis]
MEVNFNQRNNYDLQSDYSINDISDQESISIIEDEPCHIFESNSLKSIRNKELELTNENINSESTSSERNCNQLITSNITHFKTNDITQNDTSSGNNELCNETEVVNDQISKKSEYSENKNKDRKILGSTKKSSNIEMSKGKKRDFKAESNNLKKKKPWLCCYDKKCIEYEARSSNITKRKSEIESKSSELRSEIIEISTSNISMEKVINLEQTEKKIRLVEPKLHSSESLKPEKYQKETKIERLGNLSASFENIYDIFHYEGWKEVPKFDNSMNLWFLSDKFIHENAGNNKNEFEKLDEKPLHEIISDTLFWYEEYCTKNIESLRFKLNNHTELHAGKASVKSLINKISKNSISTARQLIWISITATLTLCVPVLFYYEKECQIYEIHSRMLKPQGE